MPVVPNQATTLSQIGTIGGCFGRVKEPSIVKRPDTVAPIHRTPAGSTTVPSHRGERRLHESIRASARKVPLRRGRAFSKILGVCWQKIHRHPEEADRIVRDPPSSRRVWLNAFPPGHPTRRLLSPNRAVSRC